MFRHGVCSSLAELSDMELAGELGVDEEVLPLIETSLPDVVLLDIAAPSLDGLKLCRTIKQRLPSVAVIMVSAHPDDEQFFQAIKGQASAFISKTITLEELSHTIRQCAAGKHPINEGLIDRPKIAERVLQQFHDLSREKETASFISPLTPRETEILNFMAQGYLNKQIAEALSVSEQTIKNHVTSILRKLNANARTQAVVVAIKKGLVSISKE